MPVNSFDDYPMSWRPKKELLKRPYYISLADMMEEDIKNGTLTAGTQLPPQRELADFLDLGFNTIMRTYTLCKERGLVYGTTGRGTFVAENVQNSVLISSGDMKRNGLKHCIEMGYVAGFESLQGCVTQTIREIAQRDDLTRYINYDNSLGMSHQKQAARNWVSAFGVDAENLKVLIASSTQNAIVTSVLALFHPGDIIAVDWYTYANFIEIAMMYHIQLLPIPGDTRGMLPIELQNVCRSIDVRGIFLMPTCSNPTSYSMDIARKQELAAVIRQYDLIIIEDDVYGFMSTYMEESYRIPFSRLLPENTVYICGISKAVCTGMGVSFILYPSRFAAQLEKMHCLINTKTCSLNAEIITSLITSGKAQKIIKAKLKMVQKANEIFQHIFPDTVTAGNPYSFSKWVTINCTENGTDLEKHLSEKGVHVFHSCRFILRPDYNHQFLRISLSSTQNLEELEQGLQIIKENTEVL